MTDYEAQRQANLLQKQKLLEQLDLSSSAKVLNLAKASDSTSDPHPPTKKRKLAVVQPTRASARIAAAATRVTYIDGDPEDGKKSPARSTRSRSRSESRLRRRSSFREPPSPVSPTRLLSPPYSPKPSPTLSDRLSEWNKWTPSAPEPVLTVSGYYFFESHPEFRPNKSPLDILLEGAFGGSHFSPWYSRTLQTTIEDDYLQTLPKSWLRLCSPPTMYLTSPRYDASLNKFQVQCGQTLTEWEQSGWINFDFDPRGWFEWYIRFFIGRRCADDDRQVGRWVRCVGKNGRWKRMLLNKYIQQGVRSVYADDEDEGDVQVSPVMHQTCHHWGYEVRQEDLDRAWEERSAGARG